MIPREILKKVRKMHIMTSRMVTDVFAGQYHSVFKGRGMEFYEVREYLPGDDIRTIDWNVTARTGNAHVKKFIEERELTVMVLLDVSMSSAFGSIRMKNRIAAELCSVLALSADRNNDKIGLIAFTDRIERFIPPRKGLRHVLKVIREGIYCRPEGRGTDITYALQYLNRVAKRRTITFVISDFLDTGFKKMLAVSNKRHDIIALTVEDPAEIEMPKAGIIRLSDPESGDEFFVDTCDKAFRMKYKAKALERIQRRGRVLASCGVDNISISTDRPYTRELYRFFRMRGKRFR